MKLLIDADACPVVDEALAIAKRHGVEVTLVCDAAHVMNRDGAQTVYVMKGADSADFRLVNLVGRGDAVVTQDYGLAAMCLARRARVLDQNGMEYTDDNIDSLLLRRHTAARLRRGGVRLKGPSKRTSAQDTAFRDALETLFSRPTKEDI